MELRTKVVLLAVGPLAVAAVLLTLLVMQEGKELADGQVAEAEQILLTAKQAELRGLMALARNAISDLEGDDPATRTRALERLRDLSFGEDGYFYVYDLDGTNLMHPRQPELEGRDQWNFRDDRGQLTIQSLIAIARANADGGFVQYRWQRPSQHRWSPKLGYVVPLQRWNWMLGTGIYLDDFVAITRLTRQIRTSSAATIRETRGLILLIAALAVAGVIALGTALNVSQQRLADSKLRRLTAQVVVAQEAERVRVARDLHDGVMQELRMVQFHLETVLDQLTSHPPHGEAAETVEQGLAGLAESMDEIRRVSHDLRPLLRGDELPAVLEQLGNKFARCAGVTLVVEAPATPRPLSGEAATALLRVTQQALANVERHARASRVTIRLAACVRRGQPGTRLTVSDDGCGFNVVEAEARPGGGIGLLNMRERIEALGGRISIRSGPNGTEVDAYLPDAAAAEGVHDEGGDDGDEDG